MLVSATRLYTEEYFVNEMSSVGIPEMQRSKLVSCVIQVPFFFFGFHDVHMLPFYKVIVVVAAVAFILLAK